jgi:hypothetical protein
MLVIKNDLKELHKLGKAYKGYKFIVLVEFADQTAIYTIQQKGERSWVATLLTARDSSKLPAIIDGNSKTILNEVINKVGMGVDIKYRFFYTKEERIWRLALIEALGFGKINEKEMEINIK